MINLEKHLVVCECNDCQHQFILIHDKEDNELYMEIHLSNYLSFFKRLKEGIKYIFGHRSNYGDFDSIIISVEDRKRLIDILQKTV